MRQRRLAMAMSLTNRDAVVVADVERNGDTVAM